MVSCEISSPSTLAFIYPSTLAFIYPSTLAFIYKRQHVKKSFLFISTSLLEALLVLCTKPGTPVLKG